MMDALSIGQRIAIDIHYHDQMTSIEQFSVVRQLSLCHKANKDALTHVSIHVCGDTPEDNDLLRNAGAPYWPMTFHSEDINEVFPVDDIVYLSPDAETELESIDHSKVYVIGGLVDRSVSKNQSLLRARQLKVQCMKLPLSKYFTECLNPVMNINTVVEIIITWAETRDWRATFEKCIPNRKVKLGEGDGDYNYHNITSQTQLNSISEYKITRYQIKHALHVYCDHHKLNYSFENKEISYDSYKEEVKNMSESELPAYCRFNSVVTIDGKVLGEGKGKSTRASQTRASWQALVALGEIKIDEV